MVGVTVEATGVTVALRAGETILAGLARAGYAYRAGCRRGGCGVCRAEVTAGEVEHRGGVAAAALPAAEAAAGACLTCRAVPLTDVVIRLPDDARFRCVAPLLAGLAGVSTAAGPAAGPGRKPQPGSLEQQGEH